MAGENSSALGSDSLTWGGGGSGGGRGGDSKNILPRME